MPFQLPSRTCSSPAPTSAIRPAAGIQDEALHSSSSATGHSHHPLTEVGGLFSTSPRGREEDSRARRLGAVHRPRRRQAKTVVEEEARRCGQFYVTGVGSAALLTNFPDHPQEPGAAQGAAEADREGATELKQEGAIRVGKELAKLEKCSWESPISNGCRHDLRDRHQEGRDRGQGGEQSSASRWSDHRTRTADPDLIGLPDFRATATRSAPSGC